MAQIAGAVRGTSGVRMMSRPTRLDETSEGPAWAVPSLDVAERAIPVVEISPSEIDLRPGLKGY